MELCNILKSNASFSFFPYFIHLQPPPPNYYISFSFSRIFYPLLYPCYISFSNSITYIRITHFLFHIIYIYSIFSKSSSPCPQFFLLFFVSFTFTFLTIIQSLAVVIQLSTFPRIIHSFVRFSDSLQLLLLSLDRDHSQNGTSVSRRRTPGYRKLGYSTTRHVVSRCER